jgi:hypothetical protein
MILPPSSEDVQIAVEEGHRHAIVTVGESWHGHDGDRRVILATASLMNKTSHRVVSLALPGVPEQNWRLDLSSDPDPTPGYSPWRLSSGASPSASPPTVKNGIVGRTHDPIHSRLRAFARCTTHAFM